MIRRTSYDRAPYITESAEAAESYNARQRRIALEAQGQLCLLEAIRKARVQAWLAPDPC